MTPPFEELLLIHLSKLPPPFLFVGSGVSRRYCGADSWEGLLRRFAAKTSKPYEYYRSLGDDHLPTVASLLAGEFSAHWWNDDEFADSRDKWREHVRHPSDPLKIAVSEYLQRSVSLAGANPTYFLELEELKSAQIDCVITTNYDGLLEEVFPTFKPYVGQSELIFSDIQGVGEIYEIHGSVHDPSSMVLTNEDYAAFARKNAYLAAKLLTLFVEHPIIFLGYSIGDDNVRAILDEIVQCIEPSRVDELKDRLIFVEWVEGCQPTLSPSLYSAGSVALPVVLVRVPDFIGLYRALSRLTRVFPARILRLLKERLFELVKSNDPDSRLAMVSDIDSIDSANLDVVFGVGAQMTALGVVGIDRVHLFEDVLDAPARSLPTPLMIDQVLPRLTNSVVIAPVFKYLAAAGLLLQDGKVDPSAALDRKVRERAKRTVEEIEWADRPKGQYSTISQIEAAEGAAAVFKLGWSIVHIVKGDAVQLREFLVRRKSYARATKYKTQFAKLVCVYDWLRYGTTPAP